MSLFASWNQNKQGGEEGRPKVASGNPFGKPSSAQAGNARVSANPFTSGGGGGNPFNASASGANGNPFGQQPPELRASGSSTHKTFSNGAQSMGNANDDDDDEEAEFRARLVAKKQSHFARRDRKPRPDADAEEKYPLLKIVRQDSWQTPSVKRSKGRILVMTAANRTLVFATSNQCVVRWTMNSGQPPEEFDVSKKCGSTIERLFLDPTGSHLIIACKDSENFYMHSSYKKLRTLHKTKGVYICSVAWNRKEGTEKSSKPILLGGRNGEIYEMSLDDVNRDKYFKQVYQLTESPGVVCGIKWEAFHVGEGDDEPPKYFAMVATAEPTRHYHFIGGPTFEGLFGRYKDVEHDRFSEVPGHLPYGELHFFSETVEMRAESFSLLTQIGVVNGQFMFGSQSFGDTVVKDSRLTKYPRKGQVLARTEASGGTGDAAAAGGAAPLSMAVTKFHFIFLYEDRLVAVSSLASQTKVTFECRLDRDYHGVAKSLVQDPVGNKLWLCTASAVYQIVVDREDRDVWSLYLQQAKTGDGREFEYAFQHCSTKEQQEIVRSDQADYHFERGDHTMAARYYAMTRRSFEEIALKFSNSDSEKALKTFVQTKLESWDRGESTQRTILSLWLVEMCMAEMNEQENLIGTPDAGEDAEAEMATLQVEFKEFLTSNRSFLGMSECAETTFQLISSHGRLDMMLFFAELIEDYERMMTLYVQEENYIGAVELLKKHSTKYLDRHQRPPEKIESLFYKFSPVLMEHAPRETVQAWKGMRRFLVASKLIPSLVRYSQHRQEMSQQKTRKEELQRRILKKAAQVYESTEAGVPGDDEEDGFTEDQDYAVEYLEFCVTENRNKEAAIHNFLVSLYAQRQDKGRKIIDFLDNQGPKPCFDLDYALRVCLQANQHLACVRIYSMMGLPDEAVTLALRSGDVELAKRHADMPVDDEDMRKKLWFRIAKQVITQHGDIKEAIEVMKESDDLLKIEDILPLFPDFTVIEDFKDEICDALEGYTDNIKALKEEMNEYVESAEQIRADIKRLQKRKGQVHARARCELTGDYVSGHEFYLLPDGRVYLADALLNWVLSNEQNCINAGFDNLDFKTIRELKNEIEEIDAGYDETQGEAYKQVTLARRRSAQKELDENLANGVIIDMIHIANINVPFDVDGDDWDL